MKKKMCIRLSAVVMMITVLLFGAAVPVSAHEMNGTFLVNSETKLADPATLPDGVQTTLHIYRVGSASDGTLVLRDEVKQVVGENIDLKMNETFYDSEEDFLKAAMEAAATLAQYTDKMTPVKQVKADFNKAFSVSGLENGVYLVTGDSVRAENYPGEGETSYIWPKPMLVLIDDQNVTVGLKPQIAYADKVKITKKWVASEGLTEAEKAARPDSITVKLYYDGVQQGEDIILNGENNWSYSAAVDQGKKDPQKWSCKEVNVPEGYKASVAASVQKGEQANTYQVDLTNTYDTITPPPGKNPKTGDSMNIVKYILIMAAALLVIVLVLVSGRRKKNQNEQ